MEMVQIPKRSLPQKIRIQRMDDWERIQRWWGLQKHLKAREWSLEKVRKDRDEGKHIQFDKWSGIRWQSSIIHSSLICIKPIINSINECKQSVHIFVDVYFAEYRLPTCQNLPSLPLFYRLVTHPKWFLTKQLLLSLQLLLLTHKTLLFT